ncbi:MAG: DUF1573 domain-containing protein [Phycisphaerales bacterium]|nr:MAG: DUF1573 domain-containing protein [Phycisphaerales bacterium]
MHLSATEIDFGEKWAGEKVEVGVRLSNVGTEPLRIEKIKTGCGCTTAGLDRKVLAPGESRDLTIRYNKRRAGQVTQRVRVHSNDPEKPVAVVTLRGKLKKVLRLSSPQSVNFGRIGPEETATQTVDVTCMYDQPIELGLKAVAHDSVAVHLETVEAGRLYRLVAVTKPRLPQGSFRATAVLLTGVEAVPEVVVPIRGTVEPVVAGTPERKCGMPETVRKAADPRRTGRTKSASQVKARP